MSAELSKQAMPAAARPHAPVTILLVDDNPLHLKSQQMALEHAGYRVVTAGGSDEALRMVQSERPALVLSDVVMPRIDGFGLCRLLRSCPTRADIPVVLLSGLYGDDKDLRHAAHCGANMFVSRASGTAAVLREVERVLRHPGARLDPLADTSLDAEHHGRVINQFDRLVNRDVLTGLINRAGFQGEIELVVAEAAATNTACGVLTVALGNFREINDTLGPDGGDRVLEAIAGRLHFGGDPAGIKCARLGAAEFGMLLPNAGCPVELARTAHALRSVLSAPIQVDGIPIEVTTCIGSARCPEDAVQGTDLLRRASVALHHARSNHLPFAAYSPELDPFSLQRLVLVSELRRAILHNQLELWYQPKLDVRGAKVASVEALVRWRHPERGLVGPDEFIPTAERTGLIQLVTAWVLKTALEQAKRWHDQGLDLNVAINISQNDLRDPLFQSQVLRAVQRTGLPSSRITLEITETAVMQDPRRGAHVLAELRGHGFRIALDDFGTGQASLAHLHRLPVDEIKLDKSFVRELPMAHSHSIARATAMLAREFGLKSVAEGVETADSQNLLGKLGFDCIQGYGLSRPLPPDQLEAWLARRVAPTRESTAGGTHVACLSTSVAHRSTSSARTSANPALT